MKTSNAHRAAMGIFFASFPARAYFCFFESCQPFTAEIKGAQGFFIIFLALFACSAVT
jgi:hypothetical protein